MFGRQYGACGGSIRQGNVCVFTRFSGLLAERLDGVLQTVQQGVLLMGLQVRSNIVDGKPAQFKADLPCSMH